MSNDFAAVPAYRAYTPGPANLLTLAQAQAAQVAATPPARADRPKRRPLVGAVEVLDLWV